MRVRLFALSLLGVFAALYASDALALPSSHAPERAFEKNEGQWPPEALFMARLPSHNFWIVRDGFISAAVDGTRALRARIGGGVEPVFAEGSGELRGRASYLAGSDPSKWVAGVRRFSKVRLRGVYPGIDLVYRFTESSVEYDFVVAPGADPDRIAIRFEGAALRGNLSALAGALNDAEFEQLPAVAWQEKNGSRREVSCAYVVRGDVVTFQLGPYDRTRALVIDPVYVFSTYFGGESSDEASAVFIDSAGFVYVAGETYSDSFPTSHAFQAAHSNDNERDAFIAKFDPTGHSLIFSTFLGGSARDIPHTLTVDGDGNVYVAGQTYSLDFPVSPNAFIKNANGWVGDDCFLTKLAPGGDSIVYSTYLVAASGGPSTENIRDIVVDEQGFAYVAGQSEDDTWPVTQGAYRTTGCAGVWSDGFVTKVNQTGSGLVWSTFVCGGKNDTPTAIALDAAGDVYVAGWTTSPDFPQTGNARPLAEPNDSFVLKLSANGATLLQSVLLGGNGFDQTSSMAVDSDGTIFIGGNTTSTDLPASGFAQPAYGGDRGSCFNYPCGDAFVAKLAPSFQVAAVSYLGGYDDDTVNGLALSGTSVSVVGETISPNFPLMNPIQARFGGERDTHLTSFDKSLRRISFSTYFGGSGWDVGWAIAANAEGAIVIAGFTDSANLPLAGAFASAPAGAFDAFVAKFSDSAPPRPGRRRPVRR